MDRRSFLQSSLATAGTAAAGLTVNAADQKPGELYELRAYALQPAKQPVLDRYLEKALIPALKRYGVGPTGVFVEAPAKDGEPLRSFVLIVHPSAESVATLSAKLSADEAYRVAVKEYLDAPASDPVYSRIESSLLAPIGGMPKLAKPDAAKPRLFNLRVYESHNERAAAKKVEMFDTAELAIFRRVGLTPVFFAQTLVGPVMPNLTYLLVFPDETGRKMAWDRFRVDPEWLKLKAVPEYADKEIVSHITNRVLTPAAYSEI
jgi:hypothetical protein